MSMESVNQFLAKVSEDQKLQAELTQIIEAENDDRQAATKLAAEYGFQFTSDELWSEIQNRQSEFQAKQEANELSEEELEAVAGGTAIATALITAGGAIAGGAASKW